MTTLLSGDACSPTAPGRMGDDARPRRRWFAVRRGEPAAAVPFEGTGRWLSMARDDTCRVANVRGFPFRCREGTLWITSPEEPGDMIVAAGEQLSVTSRGTIMVVALAPSSMWVPEGFAVDESQGASKRRVRRIFPTPADAAQAPHAMLQAAFRRLVAALARWRSPASADTRARYLSLSVDPADFESRMLTWDAREARLRPLPPAL